MKKKPIGSLYTLFLNPYIHVPYFKKMVQVSDVQHTDSVRVFSNRIFEEERLTP